MSEPNGHAEEGVRPSGSELMDLIERSTAAQVRTSGRVEDLHAATREQSATLGEVRDGVRRLVELEEGKAQARRDHEAALRADELDARRWRRQLAQRGVVALLGLLGPSGLLAAWLGGYVSVALPAPPPSQGVQIGPAALVPEPAP